LLDVRELDVNDHHGRFRVYYLDVCVWEVPINIEHNIPYIKIRLVKGAGSNIGLTTEENHKKPRIGIYQNENGRIQNCQFIKLVVCSIDLYAINLKKGMCLAERTLTRHKLLGQAGSS